MRRTSRQLRDDALRIWRAGVAAVDSERLVREAIDVTDGQLTFVTPTGEEQIFDLRAIGRIVVVGAGKLAQGWPRDLKQRLGPGLLARKQVAGWINVPADCVRPLERIHLHARVPPGATNQPKPGWPAQEILRLVRQLGPNDLCICLISGGASALLPAPSDGISLADKLAVTRELSAAGANIRELNTVRKHLSAIKGGGLLAACGAGQIVTLIISDVIGDPLDVIGSGPTVVDRSTREEALAILSRFDPQHHLPASIYASLQKRRNRNDNAGQPSVCNFVIGNNARAVDAAGVEAERLGYSHAMFAARELEGEADETGRQLATLAITMRDGTGPDCLISGGEPVVRLVAESQRGLGGRNQQLVLAAADVLSQTDARGLAMLSGGTDGEDGPTDAAGAWVDAEVLAAAKQRGLDPRDYLARNDAYHFFEQLGALIKTGPTHTNVCDLRVVVCSQDS